MGVLTGKMVAKYITGMVNEITQVQPCGVDLTVGTIVEFNGSGHIDFTNKKRSLPLVKVVSNNHFENSWLLKQGNYLITFNETVEIPAGCMGECWPRSSLLRMGATLGTAVWDPGYKGQGQALLVIHNKEGIAVYKDARVAQITYKRMEETPDELYGGIYQGERPLLVV